MKTSHKSWKRFVCYIFGHSWVDRHETGPHQVCSCCKGVFSLSPYEHVWSIPEWCAHQIWEKLYDIPKGLHSFVMPKDEDFKSYYDFEK